MSAIHVWIGANQAPYYRRIIKTEPMDQPQNSSVQLASWTEEQGRGRTKRMVNIHYDEIPWLIGVLAKALVDKRKREIRESIAAAKKVAKAAA